MKFWASTAFLPPDQYLALAPVLERAGFHGMALADHLIAPKTPRSPYPYTADGRPDGNPVLPSRTSGSRSVRWPR